MELNAKYLTIQQGYGVISLIFSLFKNSGESIKKQKAEKNESV